jgi:hypothetical protein
MGKIKPPFNFGAATMDGMTNMEIYIAGGFTLLNNSAVEAAVARAMIELTGGYHRLISFAPYSEDQIMTLLDLKLLKDIADRVKIIFDSGAFSARKNRMTIDFDAFVIFVQKHEALLDCYFCLDVISDGQASYRNYVRMRSAGLNPVPVYHLDTPIRYFKYYLTQSNCIGIGAVGNWCTLGTKRTLDYLWRKYLTDSQGHPLFKVHALGLSSVRILRRYPWASADTTSWVQQSARGSAMIPRRVNGVWRFDRPAKIISFSEKKRSTKNHFSNLTAEERQFILDYFKIIDLQFDGK